ncbi:MAG TPA: type II toxin-antitoxin system RelE/ParE family toxin [Thermoflexia bacterium]|jgi:mRNA interferase RelE/StbE|nr:type II toxin-antitoxin system RelE/ParE family toxin [Thermoflexia bacterium]
MYELEWLPEAVEDLSRLDRPVAQRIFDKMRWLAENFEQVTPEPLRGEWRGVYKLRVGPYRVLYTVDRENRRITVHLVGHRRDVYRR